MKENKKRGNDNGYPIKKIHKKIKEYIVIHPGLTSLKRNQIISEKKLKKSKIDFGWEKNYQTFTYKLYV